MSAAWLLMLIASAAPLFVAYNSASHAGKASNLCVELQCLVVTPTFVDTTPTDVHFLLDRPSLSLCALSACCRSCGNSNSCLHRVGQRSEGVRRGQRKCKEDRGKIHRMSRTVHSCQKTSKSVRWSKEVGKKQGPMLPVDIPRGQRKSTEFKEHHEIPKQVLSRQHKSKYAEQVKRPSKNTVTRRKWEVVKT